MSNEILGFLRFNLTLAAAVLLILAVRKPVRTLAGPQQAGKPWKLVFIPFFGLLFPARVIHVKAPSVEIGAATVTSGAPSAHGGVSLDTALVLVWLAGCLAGATLLLVRQIAFRRALGRLSRVPDIEHAWLAERAAGPAVIGMYPPKIILPSDFFDRFTLDEQAVILAHERAHVAAQDPDFNLILALLQCVCWFNPLIHLAPYFSRIDQEIARDADVLAARPKARSAYAQAMLKTQFHNLPFAPTACLWPASGADLLKERITMLKTPQSSRRQRQLAAASLGFLFWGGIATAWAAKPAYVQIDGTAAPAAAAATTTSEAPLRLAQAQPAKAATAPAATATAPAAPQVSISNSVIRDYEPPKPEQPEVITQPNWQSRPDVATMQAVVKATLGPDAPFPQGRASMSCSVAGDGTLNGCNLLNQTNDDVGKVTLALAPSFKMQPALDANGAPVEGAKVHIPVIFAPN